MDSATSDVDFALCGGGADQGSLVGSADSHASSAFRVPEGWGGLSVIYSV
jgi:hypothetical protein